LNERLANLDGVQFVEIVWVEKVEGGIVNAVPYLHGSRSAISKAVIMSQCAIVQMKVM